MARQTRRSALNELGMAAGTVLMAAATLPAMAAKEATVSRSGAASLAQLAGHLVKGSRRRDFKIAPVVLESPEHCDHEA